MSERIIVPIAIRDDTEARLQIPVDLTHAEAEKISRVVLAYGDRTKHEKTLENETGK
jgi:hypothetical protein